MYCSHFDLNIVFNDDNGDGDDNDDNVNNSNNNNEQIDDFIFHGCCV